MDETEIGAMIARLQGDGSSYIKMLEESSRQTEKTATFIGEMKTKIESFKGGIEGFANAVLNALGRIGAERTLRELFGLFEKHELVQVKLRAAIAATGEAVRPAMTQFKEFAGYISKVTTTGKDATLAMLQQAKSLGLSNEQAERAVKNAIGLAATRPGDAPAESFIRMTAMVEQGNTMMLNRFLPTLRRITDPTKKVDEALKLLNNDFKVAEEIAKTTSGQITQLTNSWTSFKKELGATVAEAVKPMIVYFKTAVDLFKALSPETKKSIIYVLGMVAAIVSITGTLSVAIAVFAPLVTTLIPVFTSGLMLLLSPISLVTAAIVLLTSSWVNYASAGGQAIQWVRDRFQEFREYIQPAIDGVTDAIKAGNIELAVKIVWAQIELTFAEGSAEVQKIWSTMTDKLADYFIEATSGWKAIWNDFSTWLGKAFINVYSLLDEELGGMPRGMDEKIKQSLDDANKMRDLQIHKDRTAAHEQIARDAETFAKSFQANIDTLKAERDKLVKEAHEAAAKAPPIAPLKIPDIKLPVIPPIKIKAQVTKVDFEQFGTAAGAAQLREQADRFGVMLSRSGEVLVKDPNTNILRDIREILKQEAQKEGIEVDPADMDMF